MITITPKLTGKELEILRERVDRRGGMIKVASAVGVTTQTLNRTLIAGTCSEETAAKIRNFLKEQIQPA